MSNLQHRIEALKRGVEKNQKSEKELLIKKTLAEKAARDKEAKE